MDALALYEHLEVHCGQSRGLLIPTEEQYRERLEIGARLIATLPPGSVLDAGCGYADLLDYLPPGTPYLGVEMTPWIYREARRRHPEAMLLQARIEELRGEGGFDVVVMLGVLVTTTRTRWPALAARLKAMARRAVVISWAEEERYHGALIPGTQRDLEAMFGPPEQVVVVEGDANRTGLFRVG
jgi:SAM-dependent methyltransferase